MVEMSAFQPSRVYPPEFTMLARLWHFEQYASIDVLPGPSGSVTAPPRPPRPCAATSARVMMAAPSSTTPMPANSHDRDVIGTSSVIGDLTATPELIRPARGLGARELFTGNCRPAASRLRH